jgi:aralkylamine N-acetyltransferase
MPISISDTIDAVDWQYLEGLFARAPLGTRDALALEQVFRNSQVALFAYEEGRLVGAGRALTDKASWAIVFDVVVEPEYQGKGIGKLIVESLSSRSGARNIMLQSVPGREAFYARQGFRPMTTAMAKYSNAEWAANNGYIMAGTSNSDA